MAKWLPWLELALALALLFGLATRAAAGLAFAALVVFAGAVAINLARGRRIDCGCFSPASPRTIGWDLVVRDLILASAAFIVVLDPAQALAVEGLWTDDSSAISSSESLAACLLAATVVLGDLLIGEGLRTRRAVRSLAESSSKGVL